MQKQTLLEYAKFSRRRARRALEYGLPAAVLCAILLVQIPQIDLALSAIFFRAKDAGFAPEMSGFWLSHSAILASFYWAIDVISRIALVGSGLVLIWYLVRKNAKGFYAAVVLLSLIAGPMLAVNAGLKESWGRARPRDVVEFGGTHKFTPAWVVSDQCVHNCAFTSGHAAAGFSICIGFFVSRRKIWLNGGLLFGGLVSLSRMMNGAHFFSDVLFSFFVVFISAAIIAWLLAALTLRCLKVEVK